MWEKKQVYVVTTWLKEEDEEGAPLNWSSPSEEHYAKTLEEAEKMKEKFMSGKDEFYGDLVDDVWISDEKEEREFFVKDKPVSIHKKLERYQQEVRLKDADRDAKQHDHRREDR